jgi:hypothetical protein
VCTDEVAVMTGKKKGPLAQMRNLNNATDVNYTHCIIHREALAAKKIAPKLTVLQEAVTVVNFVSTRTLNSRLFSKLCKVMASDHDKRLLHVVVKWLSRGSVAKICGTLRKSEIIFDEREPNIS